MLCRETGAEIIFRRGGAVRKSYGSHWGKWPPRSFLDLPYTGWPYSKQDTTNLFPLVSLVWGGSALLPRSIQMLFSFGRFNAAAYQRKRHQAASITSLTHIRIPNVFIFMCLNTRRPHRPIRDDFWERVAFEIFFTKRLNNLFCVCRALFRISHWMPTFILCFFAWKLRSPCARLRMKILYTFIKKICLFALYVLNFIKMKRALGRTNAI